MTRTNKSEDWSAFQIAAVLAGGVALLYLARDTFIPLAFAITLALILSPAVGWLQRHHVRRIPAVLLMMVVTITTTGAISYVIFNQLMQVMKDLPTYRATIHKKTLALRSPHESSIGRAAQNVKDLQKELNTATEPTPPPAAPGRSAPKPNTAANPMRVQMIESPPNAIVYLRGMVEPFLSPLATLAIVLVSTIFLLVEESDLRSRLFRLAGFDRIHLMTQALDDATFRVSRYLVLQFLVNTGFGILCGIGLYLIGVPYAALWGTIAALLRIIPYVGAFAAGLLPLLLSLAVTDGWMRPLLVLSLYSSLELVTANFLEPWLYGSHTGISSLALLLTTVFWATLWGPAGMILSTPLTVCVVVLGRHVPHLSFLHILLGDESALEPPAQFYQRLLAMDDQEARTVVDTYRGQHSMLELFDEVLIPALSMAEQDRHKGVLDSEHEEFIHLNIRDVLADCADRALHPILPLPESNVTEAAEKGRVLCFPAHDEADEIAAAMLSQLLGEAGIGTIAFPLSSSFESMLGIVEPTGKDVLCISAVPPYNLAEAKLLARQLRTRCPDCRILIGTWGAKGDRDRTMKRLEPMLPTKLVYSLGAAVEYLLADTPEGKPV